MSIIENKEKSRLVSESLRKAFEIARDTGTTVIPDTNTLSHPNLGCRGIVRPIIYIHNLKELVARKEELDLIRSHLRRTYGILTNYHNLLVVDGVLEEFGVCIEEIKKRHEHLGKLDRTRFRHGEVSETLDCLLDISRSLEDIKRRIYDKRHTNYKKFMPELFNPIFQTTTYLADRYGLKNEEGKNLPKKNRTDEQIASLANFLALACGIGSMVVSDDRHIGQLLVCLEDASIATVGGPGLPREEEIAYVGHSPLNQFQDLRSRHIVLYNRLNDSGLFEEDRYYGMRYTNINKIGQDPNKREVRELMGWLTSAFRIWKPLLTKT